MRFWNKIRWRSEFIKLFLKNKTFPSPKIIFSILLSKNRELTLKELGKYFITNRNEDKAIVDLSSVVKSDLKLLIKNEEKFYWDIGASVLEIISENGLYECGSVVLQAGDIVIDAGAHLGIFTIFAARKIGPMGKVYAFEPIFQSRSLLAESVKLNQLLNVSIESFALGDSFEELTLSLDDNNPGAASGVLIRGKIKEIVKQTTLDKFVEERNISKIDFIKADVEGMERNLLVGAKRTIKKFKPKIAICTYHLPDDSEVLQNILFELVPDYKFIKTEKKLYAWV